MKKRLDEHLASSGLFESRSAAKAAVMEGRVAVDGSTGVKPGTQVSGSETIEVAQPASRFVSRGGEKLEGALADMGIEVTGLDVLDVGASTGGFTDCLLSRGAARVAAVDVGKGQLHWRLRKDPRVTAIEGLNARDLAAGDLPFRPGLAVLDVSFISLRKVIEPVWDVLEPPGLVIALVKPQFEAGRGRAPKGVVRDPSVHLEVLEGLAGWLEEHGLAVTDVAPSRLKGPKGNVEFFVRIGQGEPVQRDALAAAVNKGGVEAG